MCGNGVMAIVFLFVGPVPFLAIQTKLPIIQGMTGLAGFGYASIIISSFGRSQRAAMHLEYADDINTYLAISGNQRRFLFDEETSVTTNTTMATC